MNDNELLRVVNERLLYDPLTGQFTWKVHVSRKMRAGSKAGTITLVGVYATPRRYICIDHKKYLASRLAFLITYGYLPANEVDHVDHDTLNDRADNLREVTSTENKKNTKRSKRNKSGRVGVSYCKTRNKWVATIEAGRSLHLGRFESFEQAVAAREEAEVRHGFHPNHGK